VKEIRRVRSRGGKGEQVGRRTLTSTPVDVGNSSSMDWQDELDSTVVPTGIRNRCSSSPMKRFRRRQRKLRILNRIRVICGSRRPRNVIMGVAGTRVDLGRSLTLRESLKRRLGLFS